MASCQFLVCLRHPEQLERKALGLCSRHNLPGTSLHTSFFSPSIDNSASRTWESTVASAYLHSYLPVIWRFLLGLGGRSVVPTVHILTTIPSLPTSALDATASICVPRAEPWFGSFCLIRWSSFCLAFPLKALSVTVHSCGEGPRWSECCPAFKVTPESIAPQHDLGLLVDHHFFGCRDVRRVCLPGLTFLGCVQGAFQGFCLTVEPQALTHPSC